MLAIELIAIVIIWVTCLHEALHIIGFYLLKIKFRVSIITKWHVPMAISLDSETFKGDFLSMDRQTQLRYAIVAVLPYFVIVPLFLYLSEFGLVLRLMSLIIVTTHGINFYLEFVDIRKALHVSGGRNAG